MFLNEEDVMRTRLIMSKHIFSSLSLNTFKFIFKCPTVLPIINTKLQDYKEIQLQCSKYISFFNKSLLYIYYFTLFKHRFLYIFAEI